MFYTVSMRFLLNGILIAIVITLVLDTAGIGLLGNGQPVSAANLPHNVRAAYAEDIRKAIRSSESKPSLLFIYASWCPYCKRYIDVVNDVVQEKAVANITAISIDEDPGALSAFLNERPQMMFETAIYTGYESPKAIVKEFGGHFSGGIPYTAILKNGQIHGQIPGYVSKEKLLETLQN